MVFKFRLMVYVKMPLPYINSILILILYILYIDNNIVRTSLLSIIVVTLGILSICAIYRAVRDIDHIL